MTGGGGAGVGEAVEGESGGTATADQVAGAQVAANEADDGAAPRPRRRQAIAFYLLVTIGFASAAALWVYTIVDRPVIVLGEVRVVDGVDQVRAQTLVRNASSETTYCVEVAIFAADRDGYTVAELDATSDRGDRIAPGQSLNFVAVFTDLTATQRAEEIDQYVAYLVDDREC